MMLVTWFFYCIFQLIETTLEECGYNLDAAIKSLNELQLEHAQGKSSADVEATTNMQNGLCLHLSDNINLTAHLFWIVCIFSLVDTNNISCNSFFITGSYPT